MTALSKDGTIAHLGNYYMLQKSREESTQSLRFDGRWSLLTHSLCHLLLDLYKIHKAGISLADYSIVEGGVN